MLIIPGKSTYGIFLEIPKGTLIRCNKDTYVENIQSLKIDIKENDIILFCDAAEISKYYEILLSLLYKNKFIKYYINKNVIINNFKSL